MASGNKDNIFYDNALPFFINQLGHTLVVAPHQDDESLGCGGTIALLRKAGLPVHVLFVSDGSMSHPNSKKYPSEKRIELREAEAITALKILDVSPDCFSFMSLKDSQIPTADNPEFKGAVEIFYQILQRLQPASILVPWRRDPHKDHRATWQIVQAALALYVTPVRVLEYFIWLWERSQPEDFPQKQEAIIWKINIADATTLKQKAIMAHTSQTTNLIDDDPNGFTLSPKVLAHFSGTYEYFAETIY